MAQELSLLPFNRLSLSSAAKTDNFARLFYKNIFRHFQNEIGKYFPQ